MIKLRKKSIAIALLATMMLSITSGLKVEADENVNSKVLSVTANTVVKDLGETVESFEVEVADDIELSEVKAEDFVIENAVVDHFGNIGEIKVNNIEVEGNKLLLDVDEFLTIKSDGSMHEELKVTCNSKSEISFTYSDITKIVSPVADKFETKEYNGLNYKLFSPESDDALPIVIWMHGRGDNGLQLRSARNATMFAEDENQAKNPCYVFAPQSDESTTEARWTNDELDKIIAVLEKLIEEGKVDSNRVYLTGHSMGGQGAWNLLRKAPNMFAAAITMAPRIISEQAELDDLEALKDLPVWMFHATNDPINLISGSVDRYNKLLESGNDKVILTELSDEEMIEFGAGANTHATNIVMANTPGVMEWLFTQNKENSDDENVNSKVLSVTANTVVKDLGETVESFEVEVADDIELSEVKAEDFVIENAVVDHFGNIGDIKVNNIEVEGNKLLLEVDEFLTIKSDGSMHEELKVTCNSKNEISFTYSDITKIVSPVADKFETKEYNGLNYKLFSPESDDALPIVIWMHGRGDNGLQLRSARNATMFAEDENQAKNPCYVFAPQSDESATEARWTNNELDKIVAVLEELIEEDKVDPNRVYLTGHSMGGQGAWNLLRKAPSMFAAAITMAPRIISEQAELDDLEALKELPVWMFHATNDPINLISGSVDRYNKLLESGNDKVILTELSDEEMIEFGAGANTHATNIVMANTSGVMEWLFAQSKEGKEEENEEQTKPEVDVDDNQGNDDNTGNKEETLPNTGAPISSVMVVALGAMIIAGGKKCIKGKNNSN